MNQAFQIDEEDPGLDLGGFDLNLLLVLSALLRFRNITHAGTEVRLSQPATSRALTRLREIFGDDLLVRRQRVFELTPLAEQLLPKVNAALSNIGSVFGNWIPPPSQFTLAMPDHLGLLIAGNITGYFREVSPTTVFIPILRLANVVNHLEEGQVDLALGIVDDAPPGFFCRTLPAISSVCLCRPGHAAASGNIAQGDLKRFLSLRVGPSQNTGFGEVYDGLEALRPRGGETLTVPDINTAARIVQDTDAVLVLPAPSARYLSARYGLETFVPKKGPALPSYHVSMIWHERWHRSSIHAGVRSIVAGHILEDGQAGRSS